MREKIFKPVRGLHFVLIPLAVYVFFIVIPVAGTLKTAVWTGGRLSFEFFGQLLNDPSFGNALGNNLTLVLILVFCPLVLGLLLATLLDRADIRGRKVFEITFFTPQVLSLVVVGVIWKWIYNPVFGLINSLLKALSLNGLTRSWLGDSGTALGAVAASGVWVYYGFAMVILLAGYKGIPRSLYESSQIDGAGPVRQFFSISLPCLTRSVGVVVTYLFITSLKTFDLVYVMTRGNPAGATDVVSLLVFKNAFQYQRADYAAAMAVALALMIYAGAFVLSRFTVDKK